MGEEKTTIDIYLYRNRTTLNGSLPRFFGWSFCVQAADSGFIRASQSLDEIAREVIISHKRCGINILKGHPEGPRTYVSPDQSHLIEYRNISERQMERFYKYLKKHRIKLENGAYSM